jgi:hypothetical protein
MELHPLNDSCQQIEHPQKNVAGERQIGHAGFNLSEIPSAKAFFNLGAENVGFEHIPAGKHCGQHLAGGGKGA